MEACTACDWWEGHAKITDVADPWCGLCCFAASYMFPQTPFAGAHHSPFSQFHNGFPSPGHPAHYGAGEAMSPQVWVQERDGQCQEKPCAMQQPVWGIAQRQQLCTCCLGQTVCCTQQCRMLTDSWLPACLPPLAGVWPLWLAPPVAAHLPSLHGPPVNALHARPTPSDKQHLCSTYTRGWASRGSRGPRGRDERATKWADTKGIEHKAPI